MNRKFLTGLAVAGVLFVAVGFEGIGNTMKKGVSATNRVVIDGKSFVTDDTPSEESSPVRKELDRMGFRLPDGFALPEQTSPSHPALSEKMKSSRTDPKPEDSELPAGMIAEHSLRMEGEGSPVTIVSGTFDGTGPSTRSRLLTSGWKPLNMGTDSAGIRILKRDRGKEAGIVCIDETDGTFILFREVGR